MTDVPAQEQQIDSVELGRRSGAIMRTGLLMLESGTASYRVKQAMQAVGRSLGVEQVHEQVTLTEITLTARVGHRFRTEVAELRKAGVNADRIAALDRFRRTLPETTTPGDIHRALDAIERKPAPYKPLFNAAAAGAACAGFAALNHAHVIEIATVFVAAGAGQYLRRHLAHKGFNALGTTMIAAFLATGLYLGVLGLIGLVGPGLEVHASGYISSVLFLLPGFALITGTLDMAKLDFSAGLSRVAFGLMIVMGAGVAVWALSLMSSLDTSQREVTLDLWVQVLIWAVGSFVGVAGFALMFSSPWRMALTAAWIGMIAYVARNLLQHFFDLPIQMATAIACIIIGILAATMARGGRWPVITLQVPAALVQIPGVPAHEAIVSLNEANYIEATSGLLQVFLAGIAILVGLVIGKLITDREWSFER
ncbi:threonine/serine ThrE exporter family protein [Demequina zhanjiangensis]|uniref:Threonine/serine exporter family protein n=1 Tax=Demequina zhanjiangensis TaxID=3051659 RepID=A0ABT8G0P7_9MICO|nr:threonine/serine exporter family protein [Demequina sp. SYSU T00b26]MDN4472710.1 threonine/serine exporter family protein [Demequina sp. SYSU T00b26]